MTLYQDNQDAKLTNTIPVPNLNAQQQKVIIAHLRGAVDAWCKERGDESFFAADLIEHVYLSVDDLPLSPSEKTSDLWNAGKITLEHVLNKWLNVPHLATKPGTEILEAFGAAPNRKPPANTSEAAGMNSSQALGHLLKLMLIQHPQDFSTQKAARNGRPTSQYQRRTR